MRHYEIVLLIHPDQANEAPTLIERYTSTIEKANGKVHRREDWGRLKLAYSINKLHKACYFLLNIEAPPETLDELKQSFKLNDSVLRHLIIRKKQAVTEESEMSIALKEDRAQEEKRKIEQEAKDARDAEYAEKRKIANEKREALEAKIAAQKADLETDKADEHEDPNADKSSAPTSDAPDEKPANSSSTDTTENDKS